MRGASCCMMTYPKTLSRILGGALRRASELEETVSLAMPAYGSELLHENQVGVKLSKDDPVAGT